MEIKAFFTAVIFAAAFSAQAADENAVLKQELSALPATLPAAQAAPVPVPVAATLVAPAPVQAAPAQAPIYIIEKQAPTYVEDSPIKESKADQLRKTREEVERQTEERIVEKLEADRVRSEQERAVKVMDAFEAKQSPAPAPLAPIPPQTVVEAPQAPLAIAPPPPVIEVKTEAPVLPQEEKAKDHTTVSADAGFISYPSADNVSAGFSGGVSIGRSFGKQLSMDLGFLYSNLDVESANRLPFWDPFRSVWVPSVTEVQQYNVGANLRYRLLEDATFSPVLGGGLSYTIRNYQWDLIPYSPTVGDAPTSWAVDLGLTIGFDVKLSETFKVSADYRYMMNVAYDLESQYERTDIFSGPLSQKELEEIGYQVFLVKGTFLF